MMKRIILLLLLCVSSFLQLFSQHQSSLLWEVKKKGLKHKTYLFGTIHLISKEYYYFPEALESKIKKSKQVVLEVANLEEQSATLLPYLMLPGDQHIRDFFTPEQYDSITQYVEKKLGLNKTMFEMSMGKMKPFFLMQLMAMDIDMKNSESYDMNINAIANKNKKIDVIGLETAKEQIGFFDAMSQENTGEMIMEQLRKADSQDNTFRTMEAIYATQNLDSLYNFAYNEINQMESKSFEEILLIKRNENWIPKIEKIISQKPSFIAVGAMHLGGKNGIIELLRQKGYEVTPVKY